MLRKYIDVYTAAKAEFLAYKLQNPFCMYCVHVLMHKNAQNYTHTQKISHTQEANVIDILNIISITLLSFKLFLKYKHPTFFSLNVKSSL